MAKVRIKASGEIMEFVPGSMIWVQVPGSPEKFQHYRVEEVEFVAHANNSYKIEFAKAAMQSVLMSGNNSIDWIARRSIEIADAMMKQLNL